MSKKRNRRKASATVAKSSALSEGVRSALHDHPQAPPAVTVERHEVQAFSGPVPSPEVLDKYEKILPGAADRIITMAELEQSHRHECENKALRQNIENHKARNLEVARGQRYGLVIGLTAIAAGAALAFNGHGLPGGFIGTGGVIGLVAAFLYSHRKTSTKE